MNVKNIVLGSINKNPERSLNCIVLITINFANVFFWSNLQNLA